MNKADVLRLYEKSQADKATDPAPVYDYFYPTVDEAIAALESLTASIPDTYFITFLGNRVARVGFDEGRFWALMETGGGGRTHAISDSAEFASFCNSLKVENITHKIPFVRMRAWLALRGSNGHIG